MRYASLDCELHFASHHECCQIIFIRLGWQPGPDHLPATYDGNSIRDLQNFMKFVTDENNTLSLCCKPPQDGKDFYCLLRCEHGGGLIKNQDARFPIESLKDFH